MLGSRALEVHHQAAQIGFRPLQVVAGAVPAAIAQVPVKASLALVLPAFEGQPGDVRERRRLAVEQPEQRIDVQLAVKRVHQLHGSISFEVLDAHGGVGA